MQAAFNARITRDARPIENINPIPLGPANISKKLKFKCLT